MSGHLVEINGYAKLIAIYRVNNDGSKVIYTKYNLDKAKDAGMANFARQLGEDIIFDSKDLRVLFDLE